MYIAPSNLSNGKVKLTGTLPGISLNKVLLRDLIAK